MLSPCPLKCVPHNISLHLQPAQWEGNICNVFTTLLPSLALTMVASSTQPSPPDRATAQDGFATACLRRCFHRDVLNRPTLDEPTPRRRRADPPGGGGGGGRFPSGRLPAQRAPCPRPSPPAAAAGTRRPPNFIAFTPPFSPPPLFFFEG